MSETRVAVKVIVEVFGQHGEQRECVLSLDEVMRAHPTAIERRMRRAADSAVEEALQMLRTGIRTRQYERQGLCDELMRCNQEIRALRKQLAEAKEK